MSSLPSEYGDLVATGWIGTDPSGQEVCFIHLSTPAGSASGLSSEERMRAAATAQGLSPDLGSMVDLTGVDSAPMVEIERRSGRTWATVKLVGSSLAPVPVTGEWQKISRKQRRCVLVLSSIPSSPELSVDEQVQRMEDEDAFRMALVRCYA